MIIAEAHPELRFVIQDRAPVVAHGKKASRNTHILFLFYRIYLLPIYYNSTGKGRIQLPYNLVASNYRVSFAHPHFLLLPLQHTYLLGKIIAHSFFNPQPIKKPAVFFVKSIVHDWSDEQALSILQKLRDAAGPATLLFAMDKIIPYTCPISPESLLAEGVEIISPDITSGPSRESIDSLPELKSGFGIFVPYLMSVEVRIYQFHLPSSH